MTFSNILFEKKNSIAYVTVNRPKVLNALNMATMEELRAAFHDIKNDAGVRVVILTGAGEKAFIAGAEIGELAKDDAVSGKEYTHRGQSVLNLIENLGKPVIGCINAFALGGGCEIAMACTMRLAGETAKLGQPEVKLGIIPGYGGTQRLPRLVGNGIAMQLLLTGEMISAQEAHRIGLVNEVTAPADLIPRAKTVAGKLDAAGLRFGIAVSRFNEFITDRLLKSAYDGLLRSGARAKDIHIVRVPGSFEIPSAARTLAETKKYDAIICLGCLLRGDTAHYDVIVNEVTRGIGQSAQETGVPHAFGVLTCDTLEQAIDRAGLKMGNKGFEAALAAVEMANLKKAISHQPLRLTAQGRLKTAVGKKQIPRSARNDKSERAQNDKRDKPWKGSKEPAKASKTKRRK